MAVVAMGKLGSREMTAASDLDLILIYDFPADAGEFRRREAARRRRLLFAPDPAPARRADRADPERQALRSRHAAQALGPQGSARDPVLRLRPLPARRSGDVGAHGADARARRRRGREPRRGCRRRRARSPPAQARRERHRPRGAQDARPDRSRERRPGPLGSEAGQGRADGHRVRRPISEPRLRPRAARDPRRVDPQGDRQGRSRGPSLARPGRDAGRGAPALHRRDPVHAPRRRRPVRPGDGRRRRQAPHRRRDRFSRFRGLRRGARRGAETVREAYEAILCR